MLKFINNRKEVPNLVIFIHGFIGGESTWIKQDGTKPFINAIFADKELEDNFDIALLSYATKLLDYFPVTRRLFDSLIRKRKSSKMLPIEDISKLIATEIKYKCHNYTNIILIGHSMGGLVAKRFILDDIKEHTTSKVKMYVSLATPHSGSNFAAVGRRIITNCQIDDLAPLGTNISILNDEWVKCTSLPKRLYAQGLSDDIVPKTSSVALDKDKQEIIFSDHDHFSIINPTNSEDIVVVALIKELKDFLRSDKAKSWTNTERFSDKGQFDNEIFVLKLLLADVHDVLIDSSKQAFFNAEYVIRKFNALGVDMSFLPPLYEKIKQLYALEFGELLTGKHKDSNSLVTAIHKQILTEDKNYLNCIHSTLEGLHKYGMLHQLSNSIEDKIWWARNNQIKDLKNYIAKTSLKEKNK